MWPEGSLRRHFEGRVDGTCHVSRKPKTGWPLLRRNEAWRCLAGTGRHYDVFAIAALEPSETTLQISTQVSRW